MMNTTPGAVWTSSLDFTMQTQLQSEWCWAATSSSVSHFYDAASAFSQCAVVNAQLGKTTCCADGSTPDCNTPFYLNSALTFTGNLAAIVSAAPPFAQIASEIGAGRVLCARIAWNGGGGHFLAIDAVDLPNSRVQVCDPIIGISDYAYNDFVNAYRGMGTCTTGYLTHAATTASTLQGGGGSPISVSPMHEALREPIEWASARLIRSARQRLASKSTVSSGEQGTFRVFFIGLNDAAIGGSLEKAKFIGYQSIVEDRATLTSASVEVNVDANEALRSPHTTRGPFARSMLAQTSEIGDLTRADGFEEYRYLKIPALQINAIWVILAGRDGVIVPLAPSPSPLQAGKRYSGPDFEAAIVPLAQRRLQFDDQKEP